MEITNFNASSFREFLNVLTLSFLEVDNARFSSNAIASSLITSTTIHAALPIAEHFHVERVRDTLVSAVNAWIRANPWKQVQALELVVAVETNLAGQQGANWDGAVLDLLAESILTPSRAVTLDKAECIDFQDRKTCYAAREAEAKVSFEASDWLHKNLTFLSSQTTQKALKRVHHHVQAHVEAENEKRLHLIRDATWTTPHHMTGISSSEMAAHGFVALMVPEKVCTRDGEIHPSGALVRFNIPMSLLTESSDAFARMILERKEGREKIVHIKIFSASSFKLFLDVLALSFSGADALAGLSKAISCEMIRTALPIAKYLQVERVRDTLVSAVNLVNKNRDKNAESQKMEALELVLALETNLFGEQGANWDAAVLDLLAEAMFDASLQRCSTAAGPASAFAAFKTSPWMVENAAALSKQTTLHVLRRIDRRVTIQQESIPC